jgi:iron complex outermembrane receptor protein
MKYFGKTAIAVAVGQMALLVTIGARADDTKPAPPCIPAEAGTGQNEAPACAVKARRDTDGTVDPAGADNHETRQGGPVGALRPRMAAVAVDDAASTRDPAHHPVEASDGAGVPIHGMSHGRFELNGRDAFSANGGQALGWDDVPPELVAGVDVVKNPSAEQVEGAIGGLVNLRTAMPFDFKGRKRSVLLQSSRSTLKKGSPSPSGSFLFSERWKTRFGEIGVLADLAHAEQDGRNDTFQVEPYYPRTDVQPGAIVWVPKGSQWSVSDSRSRRDGVYGALQWQKDDTLHSSLTFFKSRHRSGSSERTGASSASPYNIQVAPSAAYDVHGALLTGVLTDPSDGGIDVGATTHAGSRRSETTDVAWHLMWRPSSAWTIDTDLQHIGGNSASLDSTVGTAAKLPQQILDLRGGVPWPSFTDGERAYLADPDNYYWAFTMEHLDRSRASERTWRTDVRYTFDHPLLRDLRFGVRLADRESVNENSNPAYHWAAITQPWQSEITGLAYLGDPRFQNQTQVRGADNFGDRHIPVPALVFPGQALATGYPDSYATLHGYYGALCKPDAACATWAPATFGTDPAGRNAQHERSDALYGQLRFGFDTLAYPIDGNVGLRYVRTKMTASGYTVFTPSITPPSADTTVIGPAIPIFAAFSHGQDYTNVYGNALPSLSLRLKASDSLQFRLSAAMDVARPDFGQLQAYKTLSEDVDSTNNLATNTLTVNNVSLSGDGMGNPDLRPIRSRQVDLTGEWNFTPGGSATVAVFEKQLDDLFINQSYPYVLADVNGEKHVFTITGPVNGASGSVRGIELAYKQRFDRLPGWWSGIGVEANVTVIDSREKINNQSAAAYCPGASVAAGNPGFNGCDLDGKAFRDLPLPGLSRQSYNVTFMYDKGPLSSRLAWNWRARNLQGVNVNGVKGADGTDGSPASPTFGEHNMTWALPVWADSVGQLDAAVAFRVTDALTINLEAQNLLDAEARQSMQQEIGMKGRNWSLSGTRYTAQMRYTF